MIEELKVDYAVLGAGLAGSILSIQLIDKNLDFITLDTKLPKASLKASGLYNPLVFKRLTKSWAVDKVLNYAQNFYSSAVENSNEFFYSYPLKKTVLNAEEINNWEIKSAEAAFNGYLGTLETSKIKGIKNTSWGNVKNTGYVNLKKFINQVHENLLQQNRLVVCDEKPDIKIQDSSVIISHKNIKIEAQNVLFCDGPHVVKNPYFNYLPFKLTKGETLVFKSNLLCEDFIIKKHFFIIPIGNHLFKFGATNEWENLHWKNTVKGKQLLLEKLEDLIHIPYEIIDYSAGIRPTTRDRKPFIGTHPKHKNLHIFNGLGSKGVTLAPYYSNQLVEYLTAGAFLDEEVNIDRYIKYYDHE